MDEPDGYFGSGLTASPIARLNRAVAVGAGGARAALDERDPALPRHGAGRRTSPSETILMRQAATERPLEPTPAVAVRWGHAGEHCRLSLM